MRTAARFVVPAVIHGADKNMSDLFVFDNEYYVHTSSFGECELMRVSFVLTVLNGWNAIFCQREPFSKLSGDMGYLPSLYSLIFPRQLFSLSMIKDILDKLEFDLLSPIEFHENASNVLYFTEVFDRTLVLKTKDRRFILDSKNKQEFVTLKPTDRSFQEGFFSNPLTFRLYNVLYSRIKNRLPHINFTLQIAMDNSTTSSISTSHINSARLIHNYAIIVPPLLEFHHGAIHLWKELIMAFSQCLRTSLKSAYTPFRSIGGEEVYLENLGIPSALPTADWAITSGLIKGSREFAYEQ